MILAQSASYSFTRPWPSSAGVDGDNADAAHVADCRFHLYNQFLVDAIDISPPASH